MSMLILFLDEERKGAPSQPAVSLALDSACSGCLYCPLSSPLEVTVPVGTSRSTAVSGSWAPRMPPCQSAALQGYFLSNAHSSRYPVIFPLAKSSENRNSLQPSYFFLLYMHEQEREFRILL